MWWHIQLYLRSGSLRHVLQEHEEMWHMAAEQCNISYTVVQHNNTHTVFFEFWVQYVIKKKKTESDDSV